MFATTYYADTDDGITACLHPHSTFQEALEDFLELVQMTREYADTTGVDRTELKSDPHNPEDNDIVFQSLSDASYRFFDGDCEYFYITIQSLEPNRLIDLHY